MKLRVQFIKTRSSVFPLACALARRRQSYKETVEDGVTIYSAEFDSFRDRTAYEELVRCCAGWKGAFFYFDDEIVSIDDVWFFLHPANPWEYLQKQNGSFVKKSQVQDVEVVLEGDQEPQCQKRPRLDSKK